MPQYLVETRATVIRHRMVTASNKLEAVQKSFESKVEHEEEENEETLSITEVEEP